MDYLSILQTKFCLPAKTIRNGTTLRKDSGRYLSSSQVIYQVVLASETRLRDLRRLNKMNTSPLNRGVKRVSFGTDPEPSKSQTKAEVEDSSLPDPRRAPHQQPWYYHNGSSWEAVSESQMAETAPTDKQSKPTRLQLITWNIDVMQPGDEIRMASAITYLSHFLNTPQPAIPTMICLQEMCTSDLESLKKTKWVQEKYFMTDIDDSHWSELYYGTMTLIDRRLTISTVFRTYYKSHFGRDGLFVDISLGQENSKVLRLCNTHLDSLVFKPPLRPEQVALAAQHLHADEVYAGVLTGDFNAIQPFDQTLHSDHNLHDAYLALGGEEGQDDGFTWGYQSREESMRKYGPSRMDKVLFCGNVTVDGLERIGIGAKVEEGKREELRELTEGLDWITDHYGLSVYLNILL